MPWVADEATPKKGWVVDTAPPTAKAVAKDVVKSGAAGVGRGATGLAGFAGDFISNAAGGTVRNALNAAQLLTGRGQGAGDAAGGAVSGAAQYLRPGTQQLDQRRQAAFGQDHVPQTREGEYARTIGEFAVNAAVPGGIVKRTAAVVLPAVASEYAGGKTKGTAWEPAARIGGAVAGGVAAAAVGGARTVAKEMASVPRQAPVKTPSLEELTAAKNAAYQAVDQSGVRYKPEAFRQLASTISTDLSKVKINPMRHPKAASMLDDINGLAARGEAPTLTELDQLRQVVNRDVVSSADDAERFMGRRIVDQIDQFVTATGPKQVVGGNGPEAAANLARARNLNMRVRKIEAVTQAVDKAKLRAGSTGSGGNVDNAIRQNLRGVYEKSKNLTPAEDAAFQKAIVGSKGQNALRQVGKLSPQGNGLMAAGNLGAAAMAGPVGAIPGAAGMISKIVADSITKGRVDDIIRIMAQGGEQAAQTQRVLAFEAARNPRAAVLYRQVMAAVPSTASTVATSARPALPTREQVPQ
mgnify:CR=1 FL=1